MTIDEQEAESRKYSDEVIILLPLASGKCAVFNAARQLQRISNFPPDLFDLEVKPPQYQPRISLPNEAWRKLNKIFNPSYDDIDI